jgi:hypothetical protein
MLYIKIWRQRVMKCWRKQAWEHGKSFLLLRESLFLESLFYKRHTFWLSDEETTFYLQRLLHRLSDCWRRPNVENRCFWQTVASEVDSVRRETTSRLESDRKLFSHFKLMKNFNLFWFVPRFLCFSVDITLEAVRHKIS